MMDRAFHGVRAAGLLFLALAAFNYNHPIVASGPAQPHCSGIGRLGRDLTRRQAYDDTQLKSAGDYGA